MAKQNGTVVLTLQSTGFPWLNLLARIGGLS